MSSKTHPDRHENPDLHEFDEEHLKEASDILLETQRSTLQQFGKSLAGAQHLMSEWAKLHQRFLSRAGARLASTQAENNWEDRKGQVAEVASANVNDYFKEISKFAHEAFIVAGRIAEGGVRTASKMAGDARDRESARQYDQDQHVQAVDPVEPRKTAQRNRRSK